MAGTMARGSAVAPDPFARVLALPNPAAQGPPAPEHNLNAVADRLVDGGCYSVISVLSRCRHRSRSSSTAADRPNAQLAGQPCSGVRTDWAMMWSLSFPGCIRQAARSQVTVPPGVRPVRAHRPLPATTPDVEQHETALQRPVPASRRSLACLPAQVAGGVRDRVPCPSRSWHPRWVTRIQDGVRPVRTGQSRRRRSPRRRPVHFIRRPMGSDRPLTECQARLSAGCPPGPFAQAHSTRPEQQKTRSET